MKMESTSGTGPRTRSASPSASPAAGASLRTMSRAGVATVAIVVSKRSTARPCAW